MFMGTIVLCNFFIVITLFPLALLVWEKLPYHLHNMLPCCRDVKRHAFVDPDVQLVVLTAAGKFLKKLHEKHEREKTANGHENHTAGILRRRPTMGEVHAGRRTFQGDVPGSSPTYPTTRWRTRMPQFLPASARFTFTRMRAAA